MPGSDQPSLDLASKFHLAAEATALVPRNPVREELGSQLQPSAPQGSSRSGLHVKVTRERKSLAWTRRNKCRFRATPHPTEFNGLAGVCAPSICRTRMNDKLLAKSAGCLRITYRSIVARFESFTGNIEFGMLRAVLRTYMDPISISAASGMRARMESLEMLANNLANASTGGYKSDREFYGLYVSPDAATAEEDGITG